MRAIAQLLRHEPRASVFFATLTQSSLGNGAGYIALLLLAYDRFESAWAISLVLVADLVPAMLLGPVFGAVADRFSRRGCTIVADVLRAGAFAGIALVDSFEATLALAVVAGTGTALFTPAALAALPSLVQKERLPAATAVYGAVADLGYTLGPAIAALLLLAGAADTVMLINGATFAMSAAVLAMLPFGAAPPRREAARSARLAPSLLHDTREGLRTAARLPGLLTVLVASSFAFFFVGIFNVAELLFAREVLDTSDTGFSVLVGSFGLGFIAGSLSAAKGGTLPLLKRRYLLGLLIMGAGLVASGIAPEIVIALVTFTAAGIGNGLVIVYERLVIQATVPDTMAGRVFGLKDGLTAWAFGIAFLVAGGTIELIGVRSAILLAGGGTLVAWVSATLMLRRLWLDEREETNRVALDRDLLGHPAGREDRADLVSARDHWLTILDDLK